MNLIQEVGKELLGMFLTDARLSFLILLLVGVVMGLVRQSHANPIVGGGILLIGCLVILTEAVLRERTIRRRESE